MTNVAAKDDHDWLSGPYVDDWVADWSTRDERVAQLRRVAVALPRGRDDLIAVLDVGGGWGPLANEILSLRPNATVTLADLSPHMLEHASRHLAPFLDRVHLVERDLMDPQWDKDLGGPFDAAVSSLAIHNLQDPDVITRIYTNIFDSLKPGGCFLNLEIVLAAGPRLATISRRLRADERGDDPDAVEPVSVPGSPADRDTSGPIDDTPAPRSLSSQLGWLRRAGFGEVDCLWRNGNLALLCGCR